VTAPAAGSVAGQVALVTGANQGFGRQVALELGARGMAVALAALSIEELDEVAAEVEASGGQALVVPGDVTDSASVQSFVASAEGWLGPLDLLVNGIEGCDSPNEFLFTAPDDWWNAVEARLRGTALCSYYVLQRMMPRRRGRIVNLVGDPALGPSPLCSEVACSEAAVLRLTDSLALAAWPHAVSVFAINPGREEAGSGTDPDGDEKTEVEEPYQVAGRLVAELASGRADRLSGRLIHVQDDLQELVDRADEIQGADLLQLRLQRLHPVPADETPAEETDVGEVTSAEAAGEEVAAEGAAAEDAKARVQS
jgi:NAD(P)-dependent dehydrogenase (short-subunit alcohol dehydrogenase family)